MSFSLWMHSDPLRWLQRTCDAVYGTSSNFTHLRVIDVIHFKIYIVNVLQIVKDHVKAKVPHAAQICLLSWTAYDANFNVIVIKCTKETNDISTLGNSVLLCQCAAMEEDKKQLLDENSTRKTFCGPKMCH